MDNTRNSYWGRNIRHTFDAWRIRDRVIALNSWGLWYGGVKSDLWTEVEDGAQKCSCVKQEPQAPDHKCFTCYGTGKVGGYNKFGNSTIVVPSIDTNLTVTNISEKSVILPVRLVIADGQLSGVIETKDYYVENLMNNLIEFNFRIYQKDKINSSYTVEFSMDGGLTWKLLENINNQYVTLGGIRFRITLNRTTTSIRPPEFEVLRVRYKNILNPYIWISKVRTTEVNKLDKYGVVNDEQGIRMWTNVKEYMKDRSLIKITEGEFAEDVYILTNFRRSVFKGVITRQEFDARRDTDGQSIYHTIF